MSKEEKSYSIEFKTTVAMKAIELGKKNLDRLSEKYEVPVSTILTWAVQYEKNPDRFQAEYVSSASAAESGVAENVDVEVSDGTIAESMSYGVMPDHLNIRRMLFWSFLGIALVLIFIISLREMFNYSQAVARESASESTEFYQVNRLKQEARETLNSFGVVDLENGIYRIPIDSAINEIVGSQ